MIDITEHNSAHYSPRTYHNAGQADITIALAVDYDTAGEKLTHKAAGDKYLALPLSGDTKDPIQAARLLYKALRDRQLKDPVINVAGNGIYTLDKHGWTQDTANLHVLLVLAKVHQYWPLKKIISGGQTGIDLSGIVAASVLGIDAVATLPHGFVQRGTDKRDVCHTAEQIMEQVSQGAAFIKALLERQPNLAPPTAPMAAPIVSAERSFHPDGELPQHGEVFVFGSNLAGRHGKGSAEIAKSRFGAIYGKGVGRQGASYAIPTKDGRPGGHPLSDARATLPVEVIREHVETFLAYAREHGQERFFVVRLGCDLAAHTNADIAPLFAGAPSNCSFPEDWKPWLGAQQDMTLSETTITAQAEQVTCDVPGEIRVVSKRNGGTRPAPGETVIDGDRKHPVFGNRHYLNDWKNPAERERVIAKHLQEDFEPDVLASGPIYQAMQALATRLRQGENLAIACWCAPLKCHCDHIVDGTRKLAMGVDLQSEIRRNIAIRDGAADSEPAQKYKR